MADILIKHLEEKGKEHSALSMLVNQWGYDEKLIPKALQTVGSLFPHYSRHDESHSKQILVNIERLLGDNVHLLTATDTWLLLEAAYWHDIGMVVPQKDIADALNQPAFRQYLEGIRNSPNHELHKFSVNFDVRDMSKCFIGADSPIEAMDKFRQLMAEWFRQHHTGRAEKIIQAPWASAGISSPRTELIPARLYKLLGRICQMHGVPFSEILASNGLPFKEAGLAQEDCHPRFIACLLRMGDLLDLDDNRFCPVMQRIAGETRPQISKAHEDKHASIRHLRIDQERIEVDAECETIEGYVETFKWFDWLKQEIQDQMTHWQEIVPNRTLGLLPMLGPMTVRLSGEQQILREGQRPQFSIDNEKAIALLQGHNLYSTKYACVRELLQNAIDASLIRLWLTENKNIDSAEWDNPFTSAARRILTSTSINISLIETPCIMLIRPKKSIWTLTIEDNGTGISQTDLIHMLRIGGSQRNIQRQNIIDQMPEWMKPSGTFGIGFQSVFLICDEITLTTKSIFTNETLQVTMHSPIGKKQGLVIVKRLENDISQSNGTTIKIAFELDTFARSWSIGFRDVSSIASQFLNSMDPVLDSSFPFEAAKMADEIQVFAALSPLGINAKLKTADGIEKIISESKPLNDAAINIDKWNFIKANKHELRIQYTPTVSSSYIKSIQTWYRGQTFKNSGVYYPHVRISIDLMSGKASEWLNASRDKLASDAENALNETILAALEQQVSKDIDNLTSTMHDLTNKPTYSFFLKTMALRNGKIWETLANRLGDAWLDLSTTTPDQTFRDYFTKTSWIIGPTSDQHEKPITTCDVLVPYDGNTLSVILNEWLQVSGRTIQILAADDQTSETPQNEKQQNPCIVSPIPSTIEYRVRYCLKNESQPPYTTLALAARLAGSAREIHTNSRFTLNCVDQRWKTLFLKKDLKIRARNIFNLVPLETDYILMPFLFIPQIQQETARVDATSEKIEAICKWIAPNLLVPASLPDIRTAYEEFIQYIDKEIMAHSCYWDEWKKIRKLS